MPLWERIEKRGLWAVLVRAKRKQQVFQDLLHHINKTASTKEFVGSMKAT
jgi:hypothetical protein